MVAKNLSTSLVLILGLAACTANEATIVCGQIACVETYRDASGGPFSPIVTAETIYRKNPDGSVEVIGTQAQASLSPATAIGSAAIAGGLAGAGVYLGGDAIARSPHQLK